MGTSTIASAICGNPKTPCSGTGFCEMQLTDINSELAIKVTLTNNFAQDLTINIPQDQLQKLAVTRPDICNHLMTGGFSFDNGALPFHLDLYITQKLWPDVDGYCRIDNGQCNVAPQVDGSINIYFQNVTVGTSGEHYGSTGSIKGRPMTLGKWEIGTDTYGNLVFCNTTPGGNMVVFGGDGNISVRKYSVRTSPNPGNVLLPTNVHPFYGTWLLGTNQQNDLCFTNGANTVTFNHETPGIYLAQHALLHNPHPAHIGDFHPDPSVAPITMAGWTIGSDLSHNLYFQNNNGVCFFGCTDNIYLGSDTSVYTYAPGGGNS